MGYLVRSDFLHEPAEFGVNGAEQHPSLGRIGVGRNWQVHQIGPGLPKGKVGLLCNVNVVVCAPAKKKSTDLHLSARLFQRIFGHSMWRKGTESWRPS